MSWRKEKLSNICHMKTGKLDSNAAVPDGEFPFFTCAQETYRINIAAYDTEAVLLGGNNAAGIFPLKYYNGPFNAYQRTYILESLDSSKLSTRFLYYALKPALSLFQSASIGAATQYLTKPILENFQISLPSIESQNKIVSILSVYDDLIENNRRRIQLLEEAARLLYQEWFVRLRFPGHEHTKIVDGVPEGWIKGIISDFYDTTSGGTPSRKNPDYYTGDINWVKTQELIGGYIFETSEKITQIAISKSAAKILPKKTLLVAMYGATIGEIGILAEPAACNQACCAIIPKRDLSNEIFAYLFFKDNKLRLKSLSQGAAQNNVNQQVIREYPMILPSKNVMFQFLTYLNPIMDELKNLSLTNSNLVKARDLLLPRLMNGVIPV